MTNSDTAQLQEVEQVRHFLAGFVFDDGLLQLSVGHPDNARYFRQAPIINGIPNDKDVYFGPAMRAKEGSHKEDCKGTLWLWVDIDDPVYPDATFPPSATAFSGHGHHLYYGLDVPLRDVAKVEELNKILIGDFPTADTACWNVNRLMRVPGSWNQPSERKGETEPVRAELRHMTAIRYSVEDIEVLGRLDDQTRYLIRTGSVERYRSRSERDWAVIRALVIAGASDELVTMLFDKQPVGDKYRDENQPEHYLQFSLQKMREELEKNPPTPGEKGGTKERRKGAQTTPIQVVEKSDGYYMVGHTSRRISTFTLTPKILLQGIEAGEQDAIVCDVHANEHTWPDVTFTRTAFRSVAAMDEHTPVASWQWLGSDSDVRHLLPFLIERLKEIGFPKVAATPVLGLHNIGDRWLYLGHQHTLAHDAQWEGVSAPLVWLPTGREHAKQTLDGWPTQDEIRRVGYLLPRINEPGPLWSMVGWHAAACLKPWLETKGFRYPVLNITGTRGSGKTATNKRVLMPLFSGQLDPTIYDAGTTKFVRLAILGSSNAVPMAFGEFRYERVEQFIGTVLLAYDTGEDPRGRADQTTQTYKLSAPFSVDGEDVIQDAAARERIVVARLRPATIVEGTTAFRAFEQLRDAVPPTFAAYFLRTTLGLLGSGELDKLLEDCKREMHEVFKRPLPDRVRNNYTVTLLGIRLAAHALSIRAPRAEVFDDGIGELVNLTTGKSRTLVDEYSEAIVNHRRQYGDSGFASDYDHAANILWFQMSSAHQWWLSQRRRQGGSTLQRDAIASQLKESSYIVGPTNRSGTIMYGIRLSAGVEYGLDIPVTLGGRQVSFEV